MAGALGAQALGAERTRQREETAWGRQVSWRQQEWQKQRQDELRKVKGQLYLDVVEFIHNQQISLDDAIERFETGGGPRGHDPIPDLQHRARLEARLTLYGDEPIQTAWHRVQHAQKLLYEEYEREAAGDFSPDTVTEMRAAIVALRQAARKELLELPA
ncbi:hypothetical protein [Melissospora conviva]|uniref:hypothetical protein n=1 Tax=Melissospora conviva TaxID=3388432 RepID=UPI003C22B7EE